jgi:hypothetical protein
MTSTDADAGKTLKSTTKLTAAKHYLTTIEVESIKTRKIL